MNAVLRFSAMEESSYTYKRANYVANLGKMRLSGKFCDVVIKTKNKDFPAHKVILAANLKYFKFMFSNCDEETKQNNFILMNEVEETYLEAIISFAYSGQILLTESNALNLLKVACYLQEDEVIEACSKFLLDHLKEEEACHVYIIASAIRCLPLKNEIRCIISSHFESCSQTQDFFELDYESMRHILSEAILTYHVSRQILFQGLIRWILHDASNRSDCINNLLDIIEVTKLKRDYLFEYVYKNIEKHSFIVKDIMSFYRKKIEQSKDERLNLILIGNVGQILHAQVWNLSDKKWSIPHQIVKSDGCNMFSTCVNGTIFEKKLYSLIMDKSSLKKVGVCLAELNTATNHFRVLTSDNKLISGSAICANSEFIYLCGGLTKYSCVSDQVLRYDPHRNRLKLLPKMTNKRFRAEAIICQGCLYVLGGFTKSSQSLDSVERYDPTKKEWSTVEAIKVPRGDFGVAVLDDKLYIGHKRTLQVYDPSKETLQCRAFMRNWRSKVHLISHEGKLLAVGGDFGMTIEEYDPTKNQWMLDHSLSIGIQIKNPKGGLVALNESRKRVRPFEEVQRAHKRKKLENQIDY